MYHDFLYRGYSYIAIKEFKHLILAGVFNIFYKILVYINLLIFNINLTTNKTLFAMTFFSTYLNIK